MVHKQKEGGVAYFLSTKAVPDMHNASVTRWFIGNVVVCSNLMLRPGSASIVAGFVCDNIERYVNVRGRWSHNYPIRQPCTPRGACQIGFFLLPTVTIACYVRAAHFIVPVPACVQI